MKTNVFSRILFCIMALCATLTTWADEYYTEVQLSGIMFSGWNAPHGKEGIYLESKGDNTFQLTYDFSTKSGTFYITTNDFSFFGPSTGDTFAVDTDIAFKKDGTGQYNVSPVNVFNPSGSQLATYTITIHFTSATEGTISFATPASPEDKFGHKGVGLAGGFFGTSAWAQVGDGQKLTYDENDEIWTAEGVIIDNFEKTLHDIYIVTNNGEVWRNTTNSTLASSMYFSTDGQSAIEITDADEGVYKVEVMFGSATTALVSFTKTGDLVPTTPDVAGNRHVALAGGFFGANSWSDGGAKQFEYQGHNIWTLENITIDPSQSDNKNLFIATDNNWAQWTKNGNSNIDADTPMSFVRVNGTYLQVRDEDAGKYDITVRFTDADNATVTFTKKVVQDTYGHKGLGLIGNFVGYSQWSDIPDNKKFEYDESSGFWTLTNFVIDHSGKESTRELIFIDSEGNKYYKLGSDSSIDKGNDIELMKATVEDNSEMIYTLRIQDTDDGIYTIHVLFDSEDRAAAEFVWESALPTPPSYLSYYDGNQAPTAGTAGIKTLVKDGDDVCYVMFGTADVKYYNNGNFDSKSGVKWEVTNADSDFSDPENLTSFAKPTNSNNSYTNQAYTEANGPIANNNYIDGGLFLTPVAGDFIRLEPLYNGTATLWMQYADWGQPLYIIDQNGTAVTAKTVTKAEYNNDTKGYTQKSGDEKSSKFVFDVKAGYTYYIGVRNANGLRFVALDFEKGTGTAATVTIDEAAESAPTMTAGLANVTLSRTFTNGWMHPIVLPFSVSESKMREVFGDGVQVLYLDPYANSIAKGDNNEYKSVKNPAIAYDNSLEAYKIYFTKHYYQMLYAGVPAFIIPSKNVQNPVFENVTIETSDINGYGLDSSNDFTVTGSYAKSTPNTDKPIYYISNDNVNGSDKIVLHRANAAGDNDNKKINIKAMRVWIQANASAQQIKGIGFSTFTDEEDEMGTTGIVDIIADKAAYDASADTNVYNMMGIPVAKGSTEGLAPGIYIYQGRKIAVK